jgi:ADP-heptose:LPS heptosyltransferase
MIVQIINDRERIGDFLATIPAMMKLAESHMVYLDLHKDLNELKPFLSKQIIPSKHFSRGTYDVIHLTHKIDVNKAYEIGWDFGLHMTQAYFNQFGLETPEKPIRPYLNIPYYEVQKYNVVLAPYSVSLPWGQLWTNEKWNQLIDALPHLKFALLGSSADKNFPKHSNLDQYLGRPWIEVANLIRNADLVISVVSGISHLTHALGTPHILLVNQPKWGQNPEAKAQLTNFLIPDIPLSTMLSTIRSVQNGDTPGNIGQGNYI